MEDFLVVYTVNPIQIPSDNDELLTITFVSYLVFIIVLYRNCLLYAVNALTKKKKKEEEMKSTEQDQFMFDQL